MASAFLPEVTESQLSGTSIGAAKPPFVRVPFSVRRQRSPGPSPLGQAARVAEASPPPEIFASPVPLAHEPPVTFREDGRRGEAARQNALLADSEFAFHGMQQQQPGSDLALWEEQEARASDYYVPDLARYQQEKEMEAAAQAQAREQDLKLVHTGFVVVEQEGEEPNDENDSLLRSESDKRRQALKLDRGAVLVWKDLTVAYGGKRSHPYKVVQGLTGYALPGKLLAVMGPPQCGKSTLLRALAGTLPSYARVYGEIILNGRPQFIPPGSYVYVQKEEEDMIETLTIREALHYSALLRFPECSISCVEKSALVEAAIAETSLTAYATSRIAALSTGEKKRLSIAVQLLTKPRLVFLDEPNYNLDSVAGLMFMATLKNLTNKGRTVLISLQHASSEAFTILDNLLLLSHGRTIYFGEAVGALEHFALAGFPCPALQSPPDHFLRSINPDFDKAVMSLRLGQDYEQGDLFRERLDSSVVIRTLETTYQASIDASTVLTRVLDLAEQERPALEERKTAGTLIRVGIMTWRSYVNMTRDFKYYWLRLAVFCLLMISIGTVFYKIDDKPNNVRPRASAIFLCVSLLSLLASGGFPALVKDLKVYWQERSHMQTGPVMFSLGNLLSSIPFLFLLSSICSGIVYFLIGLRPVFGLFMYFVLTIFLCLTIVEGLLLVVASVLPKVYEGILLVAVVQVLFLLVAGYFQLSGELPKPIWKYPASYISFHTYAVGGLIQNEFSGINSTSPAALSDQQVLKDVFQLDSFHGKWVSLLILAGIAVGYRIILFLSLVLAEVLRFVIDMVRAMRKQNLSVCLS